MAPSVSNNPEASAAGNRSPRGDISVVICTKDRPADLARAVESIRQSGDLGNSAEIVVVEEADVPRPVPGVRYVHLPRDNRGFGYARNRGLREARGEVILFIDDDCEAERGWADALVLPFRGDQRILGVAGAVLVRGCGVVGYAENILGFPGGGLRYRHRAGGRLVPTTLLSTCNCAYRREALVKVGGFPEDTRYGGEDFLAAARVSALGPCVYAPGAVVYHRPRGRLRAIFRWFIRRGQSEIGTFSLTTDRAATVRYFLRTSLSLRVLVVLVIVSVRPSLGWLLPAMGVAYYAVNLWRHRFARAYPTHRKAWWIVPVVKAFMDLGIEVGRWKALVSRWSK